MDRAQIPVVDELLDIGIQVCMALEKAHSKGIVHRDIKPANIMLTAEGRVKVLDFGLAKITRPEGQAATAMVSTDSHTIPGIVMGTARYMSPEQVLGRAVDHRTDIFSLGAVLYEMATGQPPFEGDTASAIFDAIVHQTPIWPPRVQSTIPDSLRRIIQKSLEKFRQMRYQSAADLRGDLKRLKTRDVAAEPVAPQASGIRGRLVAAAIIAISLVGAGIFWYANRHPVPPNVEVLSATPLTSSPGIENGIYFIPEADAAFHYSIQYLNLITGMIQNITTLDNWINMLTVSPDGRSIVWCQGEFDSDLMLVEDFH